jgi:hypothetical protein
VWDIPHAEHSNVKSSGNTPNRSVLRTSRIGCAQLGQRGGFGVNLSPELLTTDKIAQRHGAATNRGKRITRKWRPD